MLISLIPLFRSIKFFRPGLELYALTNKILPKTITSVEVEQFNKKALCKFKGITDILHGLLLFCMGFAMHNGYEFFLAISASLLLIMPLAVIIFSQACIVNGTHFRIKTSTFDNSDSP